MHVVGRDRIGVHEELTGGPMFLQLLDQPPCDTRIGVEAAMIIKAERDKIDSPSSIATRGQPDVFAMQGWCGDHFQSA